MDTLGRALVRDPVEHKILAILLAARRVRYRVVVGTAFDRLVVGAAGRPAWRSPSAMRNRPVGLAMYAKSEGPLIIANAFLQIDHPRKSALTALEGRSLERESSLDRERCALCVTHG